jgi:hypothetical protein
VDRKRCDWLTRGHTEPLQEIGEAIGQAAGVRVSEITDLAPPSEPSQRQMIAPGAGRMAVDRLTKISFAAAVTDADSRMV